MPPRIKPEGTVSATIFIPKDLHGRAMDYVKDIKRSTDRSYSLQRFIMLAIEQWCDDWDDSKVEQRA